MLFTQDIVLENDHVLLRPMATSDIGGLKEVAFDEVIWKYMSTRVTNETELAAYVVNAINDRKHHVRYPFVIINKATGEAMGSTSYGNYSQRDERVEIGWTWLGAAFRGAGWNKQCKHLLLQYAFEQLHLQRVELKTDVLNQPSRKAMLKLGCVEEGVLRSHTLMNDRRRRDTIYYSILAAEWPAVKKHLTLHE